MATNRKKVLIPHTFGQQGKDVLLAREDIDTIPYSATIKQADLLPLLADAAGLLMRTLTLPASPAPDRRPSAQSTADTTGFRCAPDTGASTAMITASPATVASEFSSRSSPAAPGDRRTAMIPEPTTTATSSPVPVNSASARRASAGRAGRGTLTPPPARSAAGPAPPTSAPSPPAPPGSTPTSRAALR